MAPVAAGAARSRLMQGMLVRGSARFRPFAGMTRIRF